MDTRGKIVSAAVAACDRGTVVVRGCFDPLAVAHVRRIEELACGAATVTILLTSPAWPLLPDRARAELLAGLRAVKNVVITVGTIPAEFAGTAIIDESESDLLRARELMDHVRRRQDAK